MAKAAATSDERLRPSRAARRPPHRRTRPSRADRRPALNDSVLSRGESVQTALHTVRHETILSGEKATPSKPSPDASGSRAMPSDTEPFCPRRSRGRPGHDGVRPARGRLRPTRGASRPTERHAVRLAARDDHSRGTLSTVHRMASTPEALCRSCVARCAVRFPGVLRWARAMDSLRHESCEAAPALSFGRPASTVMLSLPPRSMAMSTSVRQSCSDDFMFLICCSIS